MTLLTGSRIGHYEVTDRVGAGGMGEVYRARDSRLGRDVALKVLPPEFAGDPERLARFKREAQLLASLTTPISPPFMESKNWTGRHCSSSSTYPARTSPAPCPWMMR